MSGIHHTVNFGAAPNLVNFTWPPGDASGITVIHGTASLDAFGRLQLPNNLGDSSFAYFDAMPATITDFDETMTTTIPSAQVMGLLGAASFTGTTMNNGYRHDYSAGSLRLFRYDLTVITSIAAPVFMPAYYSTAGNPVVMHFKRVANVFTAWMSALGQSDSATITATDGTYASGRCGMLSFATGTPLPIDAYTASWST